MSVITIIGSGQMGSALSFSLSENGHEVRLVGSPLDAAIIDRLRVDNYHKTLLRTLHDGIKYYKIKDVKNAIEGADLVVCGVSSFGVNWFGENIIPIVPRSIPIISVTKGLIDTDEGELITYPKYWEDNMCTDGRKIYAIGGPCTARDLSDHDQSFVAFCGPDMKTLRWMRSLFSTDYYIISLTEDVLGLETAVALKNGYALGTALAIGIKESLGDDGINHNNSRSALFQQSVKEMIKLLEYTGGLAENIIYAAGDLDVTVAAGRSRTVGLLLGKGYPIEKVNKELKDQTLEAVVIGTRTARAVRNLDKRGKLNIKDFPLLMHVDDLLNNDGKLNIPWKKFEEETYL